MYRLALISGAVVGGVAGAVACAYRDVQSAFFVGLGAAAVTIIVGSIVLGMIAGMRGR
jgi:hypothetical protein